MLGGSKRCAEGAAWLALAAACSAPPSLAEARQAAVTECPPTSSADLAFDEERQNWDAAMLPRTLDTSNLSATQLGAIAFALEVEYTEVSGALDVDVALTRSALGHVVVEALGGGANTIDDVAALDADLLQRGFERYYACIRELPPTRAAFVEQFGDYRRGAEETVLESSVKDAARVLYELPERGVFAAETVLDGRIETEIVLAGYRSDGALDFLAYDVEGTLATRVAMPKIDGGEPLAAPSACMSCHRDITDNRIDNVDPRTR